MIEGENEEDIFNPYAEPEEARTAAEKKKHEDKARAEIERRIQVYRRVFGTADAKADLKLVMLDLAQFCRLFESPWHADARTHALLTGRHEVAQRILDFTRLDRDALFKKYYGPR